MTAGSVTVSPKSWMKAEPGEVGAEARLGAGDTEIGDHRQPETAADRRAVDRRDDRLPGAKEPIALDVERRHTGGPFAGAGALAVENAAVAEISAGAERLSLRGKHQRAAIGVVVERLEGRGDLPDQRDVEKIVRRPPDLHQRHVAGFLDADILERTHGNFPRLLLLGRAAPFCGLNAPFDDQRVHDRNALAARMDDDGVEIDFGDLVAMIGGELRQPHHEVDERLGVRRRLPAIRTEHLRALEARDERAGGGVIERHGRQCHVTERLDQNAAPARPSAGVPKSDRG